MLDYKAESAGSRVVYVSARGSSQECPACGGLVPKSLSDRWHICPHCGYVAPRDVASAQVILNRGLEWTSLGRSDRVKGSHQVPVGRQAGVPLRYTW